MQFRRSVSILPPLNNVKSSSDSLEQEGCTNGGTYALSADGFVRARRTPVRRIRQARRFINEATLTALQKERVGRTTETYIVTTLASTSNISSPVHSTWNMGWLQQEQKKQHSTQFFIECCSKDARKSKKES